MTSIVETMDTSAATERNEFPYLDASTFKETHERILSQYLEASFSHSSYSYPNGLRASESTWIGSQHGFWQHSYDRAQVSKLISSYRDSFHSNSTGNSDSINAQRRLVESLFSDWTAETDKHEEIIGVLRMQGFDSAADRISYLLRAGAGDTDEPSLHIDSLRYLAQFLVTERHLKSPRIGVSPDGMLQIEWLPENGGILAMWFLVDRKIQFAAVDGKAITGVERRRVSGVLSKEDTMQAVRSFTSGITQNER